MERSRRIAVAFVASVLVIPLGVVAVFGLFVGWAGVETWCLFGEPSHSADVYSSAFLAVIAVTAMATIGLMVARVGRIRWRVVVPPLAWFAAILLAEVLVALAISPQPCEGGLGGF